MIDKEIQKIANGEVYNDFEAHVRERRRLQAEIEKAADDEERAHLVDELHIVDENVRRQLAAQKDS